MKLLQVVIFDRATRTMVGKPDGFPLEGNNWTCTGDVCSPLHLIDLLPAPDSPALLLLRYSTSPDQQQLVVLARGPEGRPMSSTPVAIGASGGESGCAIDVSIGSIHIFGTHVVGLRRSDCSSECADVCEAQGLPVGVHEEPVTLLNLN